MIKSNNNTKNQRAALSYLLKTNKKYRAQFTDNAINIYEYKKVYYIISSKWEWIYVDSICLGDGND